jgi:hypothetical protein
MTSFAFILGCVPLMLATGSGAASRSTMGTGVVYGMGISTVVGLFIIPVCYVFVQGIVERGKKPKLATAIIGTPGETLAAPHNGPVRSQTPAEPAEGKAQP